VSTLSWNVVEYEILEGIVYYHIEVFQNEQFSCRVSVRFQVLHALHNAFSLDRFTKFPSKHVVAATMKKTDPRFLARRQSELSAYFKVLEKELDVGEEQEILQYSTEISKIPQ